MDKLKITIVDDEPIIRKAIKYELNESHTRIQCRLNDDGEAEEKELVVLDTYGSGAQLFAALNDADREKPDYVLLDMELQGEPTGGLAIAERLHRQYQSAHHTPIKIIILSGRFDNPTEQGDNRVQRMNEIGTVVFEALHKGAQAFVSKNAVGGFSIDNIVQAIASLERGEDYYFNYPVLVTIKEAAECYFRGIRSAQYNPEDFGERERQLLLLEAAGCTANEIAQRMYPAFTESEKSVQELQKDLAAKLAVVNKSGARIAKAALLGLIDLAAVQFLRRG